jgi:L-asparaginase
MAKKPKLLLLTCGGTIAMQKDRATGTLVPSDRPEKFLSLEPRLQEIAEIESLLVDNIDSTNMVPRHWERLGDAIAEHYSQYDGFVITMGTNTLAYVSSALSFSLGDIGKPVIVTGAQIEAEALFSDARNNLVNAIRVAIMDIAGVFVVFGTSIILGCRAKKLNESDLNAFSTFNKENFGTIMIDIRLQSDSRHRHDRPLSLRNGFEDRVLCLSLVPGTDAKIVRTILDCGIKGLILRAYGSGDIPYDLMPVLEYAQEQKVPVVVTTQCPDGKTAMGINDPGLQARKLVIESFDMSMESMSTKLMWLLKQDIPHGELKSRMAQNIAGEITESLSFAMSTG